MVNGNETILLNLFEVYFTKPAIKQKFIWPEVKKKKKKTNQGEHPVSVLIPYFLPGVVHRIIKPINHTAYNAVPFPSAFL